MDAILGGADFITSALANKRYNRLQKNAIWKGMIGSQQSMPNEILPRFYDNGIYREADKRIDDIRRYKNVTSDSSKSMAEMLARDEAADQIAEKRDMTISKAIGDYDNRILAAKQQYANQRQAIADSNKKA